MPDPQRRSRPSNAKPAPPRGVLGTVLGYAAFAGLWILVSDKLLEWPIGSPDFAILASTLKGWAFVAVASLLLYVPLRRSVGPAAPALADAPLPQQWRVGPALLYAMPSFSASTTLWSGGSWT
jgi:two-component system, sensor histidine kinase and response regulator